METSRRNRIFAGTLFALLLAGILFQGVSREAFGADDLSQKVKDVGKSVEHSLDHAAKKTGTYLKSDDFHQKVKRAVDGTARAIQNAGNWVGGKIDSMSKKEEAPKH